MKSSHQELKSGMNIKERIRNFADRMTAKGWDYGRISMAIAKNLDINKRQAAFLLSSAIGASFGVAPMMNPKKRTWEIKAQIGDSRVAIDRTYFVMAQTQHMALTKFHKGPSDYKIFKIYSIKEAKPYKINPIDPQGVAAWLEAAYHDEKKGIIEYEKLYKRIEGVPEYAPLRKALKRIIKDEKKHFNMLSRILGF
jgi:hypothetical protein